MLGKRLPPLCLVLCTCDVTIMTSAKYPAACCRLPERATNDYSEWDATKSTWSWLSQYCVSRLQKQNRCAKYGKISKSTRSYFGRLLLSQAQMLVFIVCLVVERKCAVMYDMSVYADCLPCACCNVPLLWAVRDDVDLHAQCCCPLQSVNLFRFFHDLREGDWAE